MRRDALRPAPELFLVELHHRARDLAHDVALEAAGILELTSGFILLAVSVLLLARHASVPLRSPGDENPPEEGGHRPTSGITSAGSAGLWAPRSGWPNRREATGGIATPCRGRTEHLPHRISNVGLCAPP